MLTLPLRLPLALKASASALAFLGTPDVVAAIQNVASRGQVHNATLARSGSKTRIKGIARFTIGHGGAISLTPVFSNVWFNNAVGREVSGPAYTIRKAAISYEGRTVPLFFNGQRSVEIAAGQAVLKPTPVTPDQFSVDRFRPGYVAFVRFSADLPVSAIPAQADPFYAGGESQLLYDPVNEVDDIDGTTWTVPTGADQWVSFPNPVFLAGEVSEPMTSLVGIGDSILNSSADASGDGSAGGGWLRRAAYAGSLPYLSISRTGDKMQFLAGANIKTQELVRAAGAQAVVLSLGNNDIRDGRTAAQFLADSRAVYGILRACGVQWLAQSQILAETNSTDQNTTLAGQTTKTGFGAGQVLETINAAIASLDGGNLDDQVDTPSTIQSNGKFNVPAFETTLAAAAVAWSGTISLNKAPEIGDFISFEPTTPANQDQTWFHVTGVSGTGPYTVQLVSGPSKAHAAGSLVRASLSGDGIHPQQQAHKAMSTKAVPLVTRAKGIISPWLNKTKTFEIDFVNRRAQRSGLIVPIASFVSCGRASAGKAFDGQSWFDFGNDQLRYADGGGLHVEPARQNYVRNSMAAGGAAPSTKPNIWSMNLTAGTTASYSYGVENGMPFTDIRIQHAGGTNIGPTFDIETGVACAVGETWTHSVFLALPGPTVGLSGITMGFRSGNSSGGGVEFPTSTARPVTRKLQRFDYTATLANALSVGLNTRIQMNLFNSQPADTALRIAFPQLEKASGPSTPIGTSGSAATRAADTVTISLPAGTHNITVTFSDGSTQVFNGVSGNWTLPSSLNRTVINTISGVAA